MDDDQLTERIRTAFADIPVPGRAELLEGRRAPRHVGRAVLRLAAVAAAVAAVGFVWLRPGGGAQTAEAWTAIPRPMDSVIIARAEQACGHGFGPDKSEGTGPFNEGLPLGVVDARGNRAVAYFTNGVDDATCMFVWDDTGKVISAVVAHGRLTSTDPSHLDLLGSMGDGYEMVVGHTGSGASSVSVELGSGVTVTASIGHGYYLAWWPQADTVVKITARDPNGQILEVLDHPET
jgi:hypothetical protein